MPFTCLWLYLFVYMMILHFTWQYFPVTITAVNVVVQRSVGWRAYCIYHFIESKWEVYRLQLLISMPIYYCSHREYIWAATRSALMKWCANLKKKITCTEKFSSFLFSLIRYLTSINNNTNTVSHWLYISNK